MKRLVARGPTILAHAHAMSATVFPCLRCGLGCHPTLMQARSASEGIGGSSTFLPFRRLHTHRLYTVLPLLLSLITLTGCATHMIRLQPVRAAFQRGDVAEADRLIAHELEQRSGEEDLLLLDRAMVTLADGRPADAERMLRRVRDSFEHLEEESSAETTWSMLSDDDARAYHGEDYEKVLLRAMLAIANLVQDGDDAEAYSLQVIDKQQRIQTWPKQYPVPEQNYLPMRL